MTQKRQAEATEWAKLSKEEKILKAVEINLRTYGSVDPPMEVVYASMKKRCPSCGKIKDIVPYFGLSMFPDGKRRPNGHCTQCRTEAKRPGSMATVTRQHKVSTPRFNGDFMAAMTLDERIQYRNIYNAVATRLGKPTV